MSEAENRSAEKVFSKKLLAELRQVGVRYDFIFERLFMIAKHPREIHISDYSYDLPEERIAKYPLQERDQSKLLVYRSGKISENIYRNITDELPENALLIFNNTKVIHARIFFETERGQKIEIFCLHPDEENAEMNSAMQQKKSTRWNCMVGRANRWKEKILKKNVGGIEMSAEIIERTSDSFIIEFKWAPENFSFAEILERSGVMPIPPYLHRNPDNTDEQRYQTLLAKHDGSVAAPTAGLHFTERVFKSLKRKNISVEEVTLHVGAGTFKPVKSENMGGHEMHEEYMDVKIETIESIAQKVVGDNTNYGIVCVGTTSLRTIETLYWLGLKTKLNPDASLDEIEIKQWDAYDLQKTSEVSEILQSLLNWMKRKNISRLICKTQILIAPPYQLKITSALITNFHQPNSTLLLLVAAIVGDDWKKIYHHALENNFRFLSYGDGCLILP